MREYSRVQRLEGQFQRELALLIQEELRDPRLGMVTVSGAKVSRDLAYATIYVTSLGGNPEEVARILGHAAGKLRHELGRRIRIRTLPQLRFVYDQSLEYGNRMSSLIDQALVADDRTD